MFTETMTLGTKLANGLGLTIVGMGVVFTALILISVALDALRIISARLGHNRRASTAKKGDLTATPEDPSAAEDNERIAVITAAVAAASDTPAGDFIIRSIRPVPPQDSIWGLAGRQQQMNERLRIQNDKKGFMK